MRRIFPKWLIATAGPYCRKSDIADGMDTSVSARVAFFTDYGRSPAGVGRETRCGRAGSGAAHMRLPKP